VRAVILVAIIGARLAAQPAGIEGTVVDETTGKPLERVHVIFIAAETYGSISDAGGHFSIAQMPAGQYRLGLDRTGYMQVTDDRGVNLRAGQQISDLTVRMALASMVTGRVLEQYGDPVADMNVRLQPLPPAKLSPSMTWGEYSQTDDRGEFHIVTAPGKYYLSAEPQTNGQNGPPEVRTDGTSEPAYGPTYYPNALVKERASIVEVRAGRDVEGLEIHLAAAAVQRRFSVSGRVSGGPASTTGVGVMVSVEGGSEQGMTWARVDRDGRFMVSGLNPGPYVIAARSEMNQKPQAAWARFNLENGDVTSLELVLREPGELMGALVIPGGTAGKKVTLESTGASPLLLRQSLSADAEKDGTFRLREVLPQRFHVEVTPLQDAGYIRSLEMDGETVSGGEIDVYGATVPHLTVKVALDGATISGKSSAENGEANVVYLLTDAKTITQSAFVTGGLYSLTHIVSGKYRLAIAQAGNDIDVASLFAAAEEIELKPGDQIVKDFGVAKK
jgi:hypothetical protein